MPTSCSAYNCTNRYTRGSGITFHCFPFRNKEILSQWIKAMGREGWQPTKSSRLCSQHFEEKWFCEANDRRYILPRAVPTIFDLQTPVKWIKSAVGEPEKRTEDNVEQKGMKRKHNTLEYEQKANDGDSTPPKTRKRNLKLTPKALELYKENSSRSKRLKSTVEGSDSSSSKDPLQLSGINNDNANETLEEEDKTDDNEYDGSQSLVNILDVKKKLAASLENIKKKLAADAATKKKRPVKRKKLAGGDGSDVHSMKDKVDGETPVVIKEEQVEYGEHPALPVSSCAGPDTITKLPNDFIHVKFATPRKQFILKLTPKSESTEIKCDTLEDLLRSLFEKRLLTSEGQDLMSTFGELPRLLRKKKHIHPAPHSKRACPEEVVKFATMLYLCSAEAYNAVGELYSLPEKVSVQTGLIAKDYWPGFTQEALKILKNRKFGSKLERMCSIMVDSVFIKRQHNFESSCSRWIGHVDLGGGKDSDNVREMPLASEVLVFTVVGIVKEWKLPFGYFLNKGLSGDLLKSLVEEAIIVLENSGLCVKAVVCSGTNNFIRMARLFGCNMHPRIKFSEMVTSFPHPMEGEQKKRIFIIFGIGHFLWLLLQLMEDKRNIRSATYGRIDWKFFGQVFGCAKSKKPNYFTLQHPSHLRFHELQRSVSFCSMNFSAALSDALELADELDMEDYVGCDNAACFAADIVGAIDLLNSRNPAATEEKAPIRRSTMQEQLVSMKDIGERLCNLELLTGERIIKSGRWTSVALFAFTLKSVSTVASDLIIAADLVNDKLLKNFCTYRLNLDHLDVILGKLQRLGGWNGIPSAAEFRNAYKILFERYSEKTFNSYDFEGEDLTVGQGVIYPQRTMSSHVSDCGNEHLINFHCLVDLMMDVAKRAEVVIHNISQRLSCPACMAAMLDSDSCRYSENENIFLNGISPSRFVLRLLRLSERSINTRLAETNVSDIEDLVFHVANEYFAVHELDLFHADYNHFNEEPFHMICLIKALIRCYITLKINNKKDFIRQKKLLKDL